MSAALPLPPDRTPKPPGGGGSKAPQTPLERLRTIRETISREAAALMRTAETIGPSAVEAAELTAACSGNVVVTGVGKAGLVGKKLVATLASTGTPAHFLHPTEAVHGDFGRVKPDDLVWAFSNSGRSEEVTQIASQLRRQGAGLISFTADADNPLAAASTCSVVYGRHAEACPHGLAPTSSTAVMMAVGDAVALLASQLREFTARDFAKFHPGGALGRKLANVGQLMRPLACCRVAKQSITIRQCMVSCSISGRRSGAVMLTNDDGQLTGIFTDSDLARLLESRCEEALDGPIEAKMTLDPHCVAAKTLLSDAIGLLSELRISELPVVDSDRRPVGMLDITDLIALGEITPESDTLSLPSTIPFRG
ncbi:Arabinose 5-phosphate isomerase KdsD [Stieleria maiorica]|uniref:Arabinose 5-phosphate isomerase KdsD n=1 Tax=Stieleria maiorica TaxID=2795974 RepID=A0A5B9MHJ3_9BACT|nr:KpsF/GutQ family sugar-phosphate isomerase [Stieleria maiorica]QEF99979.1 Arabinose 5-phosphate isomerase KdsD [Stieleria maiorica]